MPYYNLPSNVIYTVDDIIKISQLIQEAKKRINFFQSLGPGMDLAKAQRNKDYVKRLTIQLAAAVLAVMT